MDRKDSVFGRFAKIVSQVCGSPWAFACAAGAVVLWAICGPFFGFSETWQLVINTSTTIITFLMVFIIQHTQNKDSAAVQIKLDELIRANRHAHNALLDLEEMEEHEIEKIRAYYEGLAAEAQAALRKGVKDANKPDVEHSLHDLICTGGKKKH
ncbi:MAG: low affinity iron permease family protein [Alphaproteobacteria bacterium]|nr:low affinity iron permease family protein [Alphaproteobacteria bacterium]